MSILKNLFQGGNPLTGTTEERQARMDELCRSLHSYRDLNSLRNGVSPTSTFKMQFDGFQSELKRPTEYSPDNKGSFTWTEKPGNPAILDGAFDGLAMEDRLSYTFELNGVAVDYFHPNHYRSKATRYSLVLGSTPKSPEGILAIQGNWAATIRGRWSSWWVFTALIKPTVPANEWFEEFVSLNWNTNTYEEYSAKVEEERATRERDYETNQSKGRNRGAELASI